MGTWGTSLYANDSTCDVRDTYISFLRKEHSNQEAYEQTVNKYLDYLGDQDEPLFWYALAETQWRYGRLLPEVKEKALEWIGNSGGLALWEEKKNGRKSWEKTLENLRNKLESEQPREKSFRKRIIPYQNPWNLYDIYAYRVHKECDNEDELAVFGKYILIQKIGEEISTDSTDIIMRVQIFERLFDAIPSIDDVIETIQDYRILPFSHPSDQKRRFKLRLLGKPDPLDWNQTLCKYDPVKMSARLEQYHKNPSYPKDEVTYLCTINGPLNKQHERIDGSAEAIIQWDDIHYKIGRQFALWNDVNYDINGDGTFEYPTLMQQAQIKSDIREQCHQVK